MAKAKKKKRKPTAYNRHVGREMKAGKTMKQAAASFKRKGSKAPRRRASKPKRRTTTTTRRSNRVSRRGGFNSQKMMKLIRLAALLGPAAFHAMRPGTMEYKARNILMRYTGFDLNDGVFRGQYLAEGWGPYLAAVATTYGIPKIAGLIRGI